MKKTIKKLTLKSETIKQLDDIQLRQAVGAVTGATCNPCPTIGACTLQTCNNTHCGQTCDQNCSWWCTFSC